MVRQAETVMYITLVVNATNTWSTGQKSKVKEKKKKRKRKRLNEERKNACIKKVGVIINAWTGGTSSYKDTDVDEDMFDGVTRKGGWE